MQQAATLRTCGPRLLILQVHWRGSGEPVARFSGPGVGRPRMGGVLAADGAAGPGSAGVSSRVASAMSAARSARSAHDSFGSLT